jgi:NADH:ubiquinone oxidoreductase subunit C
MHIKDLIETYKTTNFVILHKNATIMPAFSNASSRSQLYFLTTITTIDNLGFIIKNRLTLTYIYFKFHITMQKRKNIVIYLKTSRNADNINSLENAYKSARFYEREIFDLYGLQFRENGDLRRILTDYGFSGNVLLKDFPLTGFYEVRNLTPSGKIEYGHVMLSQNLRFLSFFF